MPEEHLGEFEQIVLLAVLRLADSAYGVPIRREIEERGGRKVTVGALYSTLDRLEAKGYLSSWFADPTAERGAARAAISASNPPALRRSRGPRKCSNACGRGCGLPEQPPKIAERLLRRLLPGREGEIIAGDLNEDFEARRGGRLWYWGQVLSCVAVRLSPHRLAAPGLGKDLHYAVRVLRRNPGYAFTAMLCLALGIGVNSTVFTMVNELFWQPLPVPQAGRVMAIGRTGEEMTCSYRDFLDFERRVAAPSAGAFTESYRPRV